MGLRKRLIEGALRLLDRWRETEFEIEIEKPEPEPAPVPKSEPFDLGLIQDFVWDYLNASPKGPEGAPQTALASPRGQKLAFAFTRATSPYTQAFVAAGGLVGGFKLAFDLDPRYPDGEERWSWLGKRFGTPENPLPTIEEVAGGALSLMSVLGIRHDGLDEFGKIGSSL